MALHPKSVVVIPALNEEMNVLEVLEKTKRSVGDCGKILLVDNNSTDMTPHIVKKHFPDVLMLKEIRAGKGNALRKGFRHALEYEPQYVVMIDCDGEKDPGDIPKLIKKADDSGADMVIGRRSRMRSFRRELLRWFENFWIRLATGYDITDGSSGFNVIRAESLSKMKLLTENFEIEPELILECRRNKMQVLEHPIDVPKISNTKVREEHIISINSFFDRWIIEWIKSDECDLPKYKKLFFKISCTLGLLIFG